MKFDMKEKISKNFILAELVGSRAENLPENLSQLRNLINITALILQPIRDKFGKVIITSGRRNIEYNKSIGGANNSQHIYGEAIDFVCPQADLKEVFKFIIYNFEFDQVILEEKNNTKWIHISLKIENNRKEILIFNNGKYEKLNGKELDKYD